MLEKLTSENPMIKKLLVGTILAIFITSCFAGYSSGGRSGFSGGSRSYSSSGYSRSSGYSASRSGYSLGRSGYSRSTNTTTRAYVQPRTYSNTRSYAGSSANTVIHNNHYSNHGYGSGFGGGFFSGMLGGYLGGSLANNHHTTVVAGGAPVMAQGQGMLMEGAPAYAPYNPAGNIIGAILTFGIIGLIIWAIVAITKFMFSDRYPRRNRW